MIATIDPNVLAVLGVIVGGGGLAGFLRYRSQNRADDAGTNQKLAETASTIYQDGMDALRSRVDDMAGEMRELRDRARSAEAAAAEAAAEAARFRVAQAELQAELARAMAERGVERHAYQNEIKARDLEITNLKTELRTLREELATLRAQLGKSERRAATRREVDKP